MISTNFTKNGVKFTYNIDTKLGSEVDVVSVLHNSKKEHFSLHLTIGDSCMQRILGIFINLTGQHSLT